jgi:two-component system phosphate regulon response regulator PhoB
VLPDVILLDWMLPGQSGLALARKWRADPAPRPVPILMLTARGDEPTRLPGWMPGPTTTSPSRFRRRSCWRASVPCCAAARPSRWPTAWPSAAAAGCATHRVTHQSQLLKLGPTEYKLLHYLMTHAERVHSRGQLLDKVWGDHVYIEERTVDVHVKRLREALGDAGVMVETVRGAGYRLTALPQPH